MISKWWAVVTTAGPVVILSWSTDISENCMPTSKKSTVIENKENKTKQDYQSKHSHSQVVKKGKDVNGPEQFWNPMVKSSKKTLYCLWQAYLSWALIPMSGNSGHWPLRSLALSPKISSLFYYSGTSEEGIENFDVIRDWSAFLAYLSSIESWGLQISTDIF